MDILYYCGGEIPEGTQYLHSQIKLCDKITFFPEGLVEISLIGNNLIKIPTLPKSLRRLILDDNLLTELPTLHEGLQLLSVNNNNLHRIPKLPTSLVTLRCNDNLPLTRLPELPDGLRELEWLNYTRNVLPLLPHKLRHLECQYHKKTNLPIRLGPQEIKILRQSQDKKTEETITTFHQNRAARRIQQAWDNYWYRPNEEGESRAAKSGYRRLTQDM